MLKNYLLITWRNLIRQRTFSLINILGLALSMAAALCIFEYVRYEWSFDRHIAGFEQKYRVYNDRFQNGVRIQHGTITYPMVGPALKQDYPEIRAYTRMMPQRRLPVSLEEKVFIENNALIADQYFLDFFSVPILAGKKDRTLREYNTVALSQSLAQKYFGYASHELDKALGKIIEISNDKNPCKVIAVYQDFPANSHLAPDILLSYETLIHDAGSDGEGKFFADVSRNWSDFYHYIELNEGADLDQFQEKMEEFGLRYFEEGEISGSVEKFYLQALSEAYLHSDFEYEIGRTNNAKAIYTLFGIALFILLIAWINYINLTTARSLDRAQEVGVRKVLGASRKQLVRQFLVESLIYNLMGLLVAITLIQVLQPSLNNWIQRPLHLTNLFSFSSDQSPVLLGSILGIWILGVLGSGLYPAWILSGFKPVSVLKGKLTRGKKGNLFRRGLVTFQFGCSLLLILATITVYRQLSFMQQQPLGINLDQKLVIQGPLLHEFDSTFIHRVQTFKSELLRNPEVSGVASSSSLPGNRLPRVFDVLSEKMGPEQKISLNRMNIDFDFLDLYKIQFLVGRNFRKEDHDPDFRNLQYLIVNESASQLLGYAHPEEILNQSLQMFGKQWEVIGVVEDFHQRSLRYPIEPIVFLPTYSTFDYYSLAVAPQELDKTLTWAESSFNTVFPGNNFTYFFMDQRFEESYQEDQRFGQLFALFALLAIVIAFMGLFGLSSFNMKQRTKEIGIRKVLGAEVQQLIILLSKEYIMLMALGCLLALPLAYFFMQRWLSGYAYSFSFDVFMFLIPIVLLATVGLFTISLQTFQTARANPIEALRNE